MIVIWFIIGFVVGAIAGGIAGALLLGFFLAFCYSRYRMDNEERAVEMAVERRKKDNLRKQGYLDD